MAGWWNERGVSGSERDREDECKILIKIKNNIYSYYMNSLTLPPLSQATKLPETKKRILLAEIAMYWSILASPEIPVKDL
jgi:hypothetical protein